MQALVKGTTPEQRYSTTNVGQYALFWSGHAILNMLRNRLEAFRKTYPALRKKETFIY